MAASNPEVQREKTVLMPVDDPETTAKLVEWVIANCKGDVVHVMHVVPISLVEAGSRVPLVSYPMVVETDSDKDEPVRKFLKAGVCDKLAAAGIAYKVDVVRYLADNNSIGEAICARADELKADAVVLCKHQRGVISEFFLGSVCKYCTQHCKRPLVLIH